MSNDTEPISDERRAKMVEFCGHGLHHTDPFYRDILALDARLTAAERTLAEWNACEAADAAERIECRRCGEVEPCSDRFLCATCQGRMDREDA